MKKYLLKIAGTSWLLIGLFLLTRGLILLYPYAQTNIALVPFQQKASMLFYGIYYLLRSNTEVVIFYVCAGLLMGFLKARTIFKKIVDRNVTRIESLKKENYSVLDTFAKKDYIIMACMMLLGASMRLLEIPHDLRGCILIAVGSALIQGSIFYFQKK